MPPFLFFLDPLIHSFLPLLPSLFQDLLESRHLLLLARKIAQSQAQTLLILLLYGAASHPIDRFQAYVGKLKSLTNSPFPHGSSPTITTKKKDLPTNIAEVCLASVPGIDLWFHDRHLEQTPTVPQRHWSGCQ